ncbi:FAD dependent oxidoreductase, partial [Metarhizium brunneum ARSEF 3297]
MAQKQKRVAVVGGMSPLCKGLAYSACLWPLACRKAPTAKGHSVTVFERYQYDKNKYEPDEDDKVQAASVDVNKIFRASYGKKLHYQRLAMESREAWLRINQGLGDALFLECGMLRVQPSDELAALEKETLANMQRDGFRDTQFVKSDARDRERAARLGWEEKLLDFEIPGGAHRETFDAVLDSLGGLTRCSAACYYFYKLAASAGVKFVFGPEEGAFASFIEKTSTVDGSKPKVLGLKTKDGKAHEADLLSKLSYHLESAAGSLVTFKIDPENKALWDKYSPEKFPVITWKSAPRAKDGKDTGSIYVFPRTSGGIIKIGYRGVKFTNFEKAPDGVPFTQDGQWSIPLPYDDCKAVPPQAEEAIRTFVSIFLPEFDKADFDTTKLCWYTDSLDNSFVIDYVPDYAENSVFVCTGGSGHGAKFMPVLGDVGLPVPESWHVTDVVLTQHAADVFNNADNATSHMRTHWRWREDVPRRNGLEDGPGGPRNIGGRSR